MITLRHDPAEETDTAVQQMPLNRWNDTTSKNLHLHPLPKTTNLGHTLESLRAPLFVPNGTMQQCTKPAISHILKGPSFRTQRYKCNPKKTQQHFGARSNQSMASIQCRRHSHTCSNSTHSWLKDDFNGSSRRKLKPTPILASESPIVFWEIQEPRLYLSC